MSALCRAVLFIVLYLLSATNATRTVCSVRFIPYEHAWVKNGTTWECVPALCTVVVKPGETCRYKNNICNATGNAYKNSSACGPRPTEAPTTEHTDTQPTTLTTGQTGTTESTTQHTTTPTNDTTQTTTGISSETSRTTRTNKTTSQPSKTTSTISTTSRSSGKTTSTTPHPATNSTSSTPYPTGNAASNTGKSFVETGWFIVLMIFLALLVLVLIILIICCCRSRKKKEQPPATIQPTVVLAPPPPPAPTPPMVMATHGTHSHVHSKDVSVSTEEAAERRKSETQRSEFESLLGAAQWEAGSEPSVTGSLHSSMSQQQHE